MEPYLAGFLTNKNMPKRVHVDYEYSMNQPNGYGEEINCLYYVYLFAKI